ncbi:MAG: cyclase [Solirubrobacterales bacterium]
MRTTLLIRHRVGDFDVWRGIYEGFAPQQAAGGVRSQMALRAADDPADIVVTHTFDSREAAEAYLANAELRAAMADATVDQDSVSIEFFDEVVPVTA